MENICSRTVSTLSRPRCFQDRLERRPIFFDFGSRFRKYRAPRLGETREKENGRAPRRAPRSVSSAQLSCPFLVLIGVEEVPCLCGECNSLGECVVNVYRMIHAQCISKRAGGGVFGLFVLNYWFISATFRGNNSRFRFAFGAQHKCRVIR